MILVFVLHSLFASVFTAAKIALSHSQPFFMLGSRMLIAGFILTLYLMLTKKWQTSLLKLHWTKILGLAVFNIYLTNGLEFWGMQYLSSSKTSFLYSLSPFFSALLSYFLYREKLSGQKWFGLVLGFLGFLPILMPEAAAEAPLWDLGFLSAAELAVMAAAIATVYGWILMKDLINADVSPLLANGASMLLGGSFAVIHSLCTENWNPTPIFGEPEPFWKATGWMVLTSSLICYNLYGYLLKRFTVTFISFCAFVIPFITAGFSWVTLGENLPENFFLSGVIVFIGLGIFYQQELKKEGIRRGP